MRSDIKPENVHLHCRCCLEKFADGKSINTSEISRPLFQLFRYCTGFRTWQKGLYPDFVCETCYELLKSFENFEKLCKQSSCFLEDLLNGHKINHDNNIDAVKSGETPIKVNQVPWSEKETLEPVHKNKDQANDSSNPIEGIEHTDTDFEDTLALAEIDDAEVKSEDSSLATTVRSDKEFYTDESDDIEPISKMKGKIQMCCEECDNVFMTALKLKQHIKKIHTNKNLKTSKETCNIRRKCAASNYERTDLISSLKGKSPELRLDIIEVLEPQTTADPSHKMAFENVVVKPKLEDSSSAHQQLSDSDFEDSLTLTELRKSNAKLKAKKPAKNKTQKGRSSPLNSECETFGPLKLEKPKVVCDKCPRKFKWPFELRRHIKEMHGDKPVELPCKYDCGKIFNSQNTLKSHYRIKHQMKKQIYRENAYICEQCGKGFKRMPLLERHRFHHLPPEARPYKCEQCGKTFVMERIYKEHLLRHFGNKKFECSFCGIKKATLGEYREHINIHTKEKEYACELCPKIFYRSKNLVQHVSAVHQGIKKHFCRFCQHSFANHINLVHHERIHTGEKPYSCEICKRSFIQPSALKTHMKTHDETRVKAKVGRKPKNSKAKEEFDFEAIMDDNLHQQINNYNE